MNLLEVLDTTIEYHSQLNPVLWQDGKMIPEIKKTLIDIADLFYSELEHKPKILDIVVMGSMANFNWSKYSDVDLHIVVDLEGTCDPLLFKNYLYSQKVIWNNEHDITIKGYDVEIYVQDVEDPYHSAGVYSLLNDMWVSKPKYFQPSVDDMQVMKKADFLANEIESVDETQCSNAKHLEKLNSKIKKMRQDGLDQDGEFSVGNYVFKILRNNGYLDLLRKKRIVATDACYSVESNENV